MAEVLAAELSMKVNPEDVIETAQSGYRLNHRIVIRDLRQASAAGVNSDSRGTGDSVDRCAQILGELRTGRQLRAPELAKVIGCSYSTVKRELNRLKADGKIAFVGAAKTGHYRVM